MAPVRDRAPERCHPPRPDLAVLVRGEFRQHVDDPQFARHLLAGFAEVGDWAGASVVGEVAPGGSATTDTTYLRQLFTTYRAVASFRRAAALADTLFRQHGHDAPLLYALAFACGDLEDWPRVVKIGDALAKADPDVLKEKQYGLLMATAYDRVHRPHDAAALLATMTVRFPRDAAVWLRYTQVLRQLGQPKKAAAAIARAFQLDRDQSHVADATVWLWYADELRRAGRPLLASEAARRAATLLSEPGLETERHDSAPVSRPQRAPH